VLSAELEVVWPLHRTHYLTIKEPDLMPTVTPAVDGRELAARAFVAAACTQARIATLLGVSRRTVGRSAELDVAAALGKADTLTQARACLAESAERGSTAQERDAALEWLDHALGEQPVREWPRQPAQLEARDAPHSVDASREVSGQPSAACDVAGLRSNAVGHVRTRVSKNGRSATVSPTRHTRSPSPPAPGFALERVEALTREQQRIERRSLILGCVVTTLDAAPLREALADLVADIAEAARTIGRLVQQATR
jgi:hypothetical protein